MNTQKLRKLTIFLANRHFHHHLGSLVGKKEKELEPLWEVKEDLMGRLPEK